MVKSAKKSERDVTLVKARFHVGKDKSSGVVRFRWSDRSVTERSVSSVSEYLEFLNQIHRADLQKPAGM
jgi:hypothetical protein